METYKIYPLLFGEAELDKSSLTYRRDPGVMRPIPYLGYLIRNEKTCILVDTGPGSQESCAKYHYPFRRTEAQTVEAALAKVGATLQKVQCVIITHLHFDHCGNDGLFPHAKFYVQKKELEFAHNPMPAFYGSYEKTVLLNGDEPCWYETRDRFIPVNGDFQLKDGIKLLLTPGHSPGSQSVAVNTERGIYLIAGDCIPLYVSWEVKLNGYPVPGGILTDMKAFYQSFEKIEKESDFILPGHDYRVLDHFVYPPEVESVH